MKTDLSWTRGGAELEGGYRFKLWRRWNTGATGRIVAFVMLNPSRANATDDDNTVRRCIGFAKAWGYDGLDVVNLFAKISTDPRGLKDGDNPTGDPRCLEALLESALGAVRVVVAWGVHGNDHNDRVVEVYAAFRRCAISLEAFLGATHGGQPRHPLRLASSHPLQLWAMNRPHEEFAT